jgi:hypothetical protein
MFLPCRATSCRKGIRALVKWSSRTRWLPRLDGDTIAVVTLMANQVRLAQAGRTATRSVWSASSLSTLRSAVHPPQCCPPSAVLLRRTGYGGRATEDGLALS